MKENLSEGIKCIETTIAILNELISEKELELQKNFPKTINKLENIKMTLSTLSGMLIGLTVANFYLQSTSVITSDFQEGAIKGILSILGLSLGMIGRLVYLERKKEDEVDLNILKDLYQQLKDLEEIKETFVKELENKMLKL